MSGITGTYRKGKVVLDSPVDWPEGTRVEVSSPGVKIGLTEAEWPTTPEGIAELQQRMAALEPLEITPEEEADWLEWRAKTKQYTIERIRQRWREED